MKEISKSSTVDPALSSGSARECTCFAPVSDQCDPLCRRKLVCLAPGSVNGTPFTPKCAAEPTAMDWKITRRVQYKGLLDKEVVAKVRTSY